MDEVLGRDLRPGVVERDDRHPADSEQIELVQFPPTIAQQARRAPGCEYVHGVRVEGEYGVATTDDPPVTAVDAVESPYGDFGTGPDPTGEAATTAARPFPGRVEHEDLHVPFLLPARSERVAHGSVCAPRR
ncbi:hypothetical protein GCM10010254_20600 [Streptomyces chromofuscus]|nr:hypothetical protein GCM10010254_20600 [Streptomyces chromofuscus]